MNNCEQKVVITIAILLAIVLTVATCCVTYYNLTALRVEKIASGKPSDTVLYIHKLDDEQFAQLIDSLKVDKEKSDGTKQ